MKKIRLESEDEGVPSTGKTLSVPGTYDMFLNQQGSTKVQLSVPGTNGTGTGIDQ